MNEKEYAVQISAAICGINKIVIFRTQYKLHRTLKNYKLNCCVPPYNIEKTGYT